MKSFKQDYRLLFLAVIFLCGTLSPVQAQRKRNDKKIDPEELEADRRVSEFYFIEGEKFFILEDYAKALGSFQKCLELTPDNAAVNYMIARIMLKNEQYTQAETYILRAIKLEPDNKFYYLLAKDIYTADGDFEKAAEYYEIMISKIPSLEIYYLELAGLYLYQNKLDEALDTYNRAENSFGVIENISFQKQQIYLRQNNIEKAIAVGQDLVDTYPGEQRYIISLAEVMHANNREKESMELLESYLDDYGSNTRVKILLSEYYRKAEDFKKSSKLITDAFEDPYLDPQGKIQVLINYIANFPEKYYVQHAIKLGEILMELHPEDGDTYLVNADLLTQLVTTSEQDNERELREKAATYYYTALKYDESQFSIWQNLLNLELQLGKWNNLAQHSEEALLLFPNNALVYLFAGIGFSRKKEYDVAINYFEQGRKMANDPQLLGNFYTSLGDAYNAKNDYQNSDKNYEQALALNPDNDIVLNNYSYYLSLRKENLDKDREMSLSTIRRNPDNPTYLDTYAWILYQLEEFDEAKVIFEKAISIQSTNAVYYDHYGDVLFKLGDVNGAVENWEKAQGLNKDLKDIDKKIAERKIYE